MNDFIGAAATHSAIAKHKRWLNASIVVMVVWLVNLLLTPVAMEAMNTTNRVGGILFLLVTIGAGLSRFLGGWILTLLTGIGTGIEAVLPLAFVVAIVLFFVERSKIKKYSVAKN